MSLPVGQSARWRWRIRHAPVAERHQWGLTLLFHVSLLRELSAPVPCLRCGGRTAVLWRQGRLDAKRIDYYYRCPTCRHQNRLHRFQAENLAYAASPEVFRAAFPGRDQPESAP